MKKYLGTVVPTSDNYFATLNSAVFSDGSFVYVPPGVRRTAALWRKGSTGPVCPPRWEGCGQYDAGPLAHQRHRLLNSEEQALEVDRELLVILSFRDRFERRGQTQAGIKQHDAATP